MAIAFDTSNYQTGDTIASRTCSLAATGADRIAVIATRWWTNTDVLVPTVTVNGSGTGVVQIGSTLEYAGDDRHRIALFYFLAPSTSSVAYLATWSGSVYSAAIGVVTYTGVHQSTPITGTLQTAEDLTAAPSITVSSATGEVVVAAMGANYPAAGTPAADGAQNSRILQSNWAGTQAAFGISDKAGAASVTQSWTIDSAVWQVLGARLAAAGGSSVAPLAAAYYYN
jgi:hypothetical protein